MVISTKWSLRRVESPTTSGSTSASIPLILIHSHFLRIFSHFDLREFVFYTYHMPRAQSHFSHPTVKPSNILVDAVSMALLKDSTIDFATELIGSSFRVVDNPQVNSRSLRLPLRREMCTLLSEDTHVSTLLAFIYLFLTRLTCPANARSCYNHVITS